MAGALLKRVGGAPGGASARAGAPPGAPARAGSAPGESERRFSVVVVYADGDIDVASDDDALKARSLYETLRGVEDGVSSVTLFERGHYVAGVTHGR